MKSDQTLEYEAEAKAASTDDFKLVASAFSEREARKRLDAGDDPVELIRRAGRLGYLFGFTEGYGRGTCDEAYDNTMRIVGERRNLR